MKGHSNGRLNGQWVPRLHRSRPNPCARLLCVFSVQRWFPRLFSLLTWSHLSPLCSDVRLPDHIKLNDC